MYPKFSSELDFEKIKQDYSIDNRLQIKDVWSSEVALSISNCLTKEIEYVYGYSSKGRSMEASEAELKSKSPQALQVFTNELYNDASQGIGFFYGRHLVKANNPDTPQLLKDVAQYLNSEELLEKFRYISGKSDITSSNAKASRYLPGNYLTRHNDLHKVENRRLAYVLGFTPSWHPDWGGLLQFYEKNGTPRDAWVPSFNSMMIFDVNHIHAVTYVAPFAVAPRLTITGFFKAS